MKQMASFKGDGRFTQHVGDAQDNSQPVCDELLQEEELPPHMLRERHVWKRHYQDDIEELYRVYVANGRIMFGGAFHQLANVDHFADFVFKCMQPGSLQV